MIGLLAVQAITTAALALVTIKLRRELFPMIATAGPVDAGFWLRSITSYRWRRLSLRRLRQ